MKLSDISEIIIGSLQNREEVPESIHKYQILNLKVWEQKTNDYQTICTKKEMTKTITKKNDIIIRLTAPIKIILINNDSENLLVTSSMCIIRLTNPNINPEFLKWYLESPKFQEQIEKSLVGTSIKKISINTLKNLTIPKIPHNIQEELAALIKAWNQEKEISLKIIKNKEHYYNQVMQDIIKGYDNND